MSTNRKIMAVTAISILLTPIIYFIFMLFNNNTTLSTDINMWGEFGSYFGGLLSPITSFAAAYLIYDNLKKDMLNQKLQIIRDSITRLDIEIQNQLNMTIVNSNFGQHLTGSKVIDIIRDYSNLNDQVSDKKYVFFFSILDSIGIMSGAVEHYLFLLNHLESSENEIKNIEKLYWISKYAPTVTKLYSILNIDYIKTAMKPNRFNSINKIILSDKEL